MDVPWGTVPAAPLGCGRLTDRPSGLRSLFFSLPCLPRFMSVLCWVSVSSALCCFLPVYTLRLFPRWAHPALGLTRSDLVWFGLTWYAIVWLGLVWFGLPWLLNPVLNPTPSEL